MEEIVPNEKKEVIYVTPEGVADTAFPEYSYDVEECFNDVPEMAKTLLRRARSAKKAIERMLYEAPAFINLVKASIPEWSLQAVLTDEQKLLLRTGALELMTKKDGSLMATLIDPETHKIVATVPLQDVNLTPVLSQAMTNYAMQMQLAQIAEDIQEVQTAVEEVRQGQEYDRLATAYSCQQKLIQAMAMRNPELRTNALLRIAMDAEDSRNLLMQSQSVNIAFIKEQPESFWGKLISGAKPEKIEGRMHEIRESLGTVNLVSLAEAIAYQEMGEDDAARQSLEYYAEYIKKTYLDTEGLVERLDMIDPAPENYWTKALPEIQKRIMELPGNQTPFISAEDDDGEETEDLQE